MFYLAKYLRNAAKRMNFVYLYVTAYSVPSVVTGVVIAVRITSMCCWKWILFGVHTCILIHMISLTVYSFKVKLASASKLNISIFANIVGTWKTKKLRNSFVILILLSIILLLDLLELVIEPTDSLLAASVVFNSMLGPCLLILEGLTYDSSFRRPFRWQQQRAERKAAMQLELKRTKYEERKQQYNIS